MCRWLVFFPSTQTFLNIITRLISWRYSLTFVHDADAGIERWCVIKAHMSCRHLILSFQQSFVFDFKRLENDIQNDPGSVTFAMNVLDLANEYESCGYVSTFSGRTTMSIYDIKFQKLQNISHVGILSHRNKGTKDGLVMLWTRGQPLRYAYSLYMIQLWMYNCKLHTMTVFLWGVMTYQRSIFNDRLA